MGRALPSGIAYGIWYTTPTATDLRASPLFTTEAIEIAEEQVWSGDIRGAWPPGAIVTENGEPHLADNGAGRTRKGSPEMFQLRWTEPGGPQTAYLAPAAAALDMYVNLLCNGYTVEVRDRGGTKLTPGDLVQLAADPAPLSKKRQRAVK